MLSRNVRVDSTITTDAVRERRFYRLHVNDQTKTGARLNNAIKMIKRYERQGGIIDFYFSMAGNVIISCHSVIKSKVLSVVYDNLYYNLHRTT